MFHFPCALFKARDIFGALSRAGFVQFGHPHWYNYDPCVFDTTCRSSSGECPIIQVDHEEILCRNGIKVLGKLFSSFLDYAEGIAEDKTVLRYLGERETKVRQQGPA